MSWIPARCLLVTFAISGIALEAYAQQYAGGQAPGTQPRRMTVVETTVTTQQAPLISIVGAVEMSGVYSLDGKTILLSEVIKAAGGLSENATPMIRVLRNGRPGLQYYYRPDSTEVVMAGDIVVAVPQPKVLHQKTKQNETIIPVICLGLQDRPVCLPLAPSIASVEMLTRNLGQSEEVGASAIVYDPFSRRDQRYLVSGSVVIFNSRLVNRFQFQAAETFPPTLPLEAPKPEAAPAPVTQSSALNETEELQLPQITPDTSASSLSVMEQNRPSETTLTAPAFAQESGQEPAPVFNTPSSVVTVGPVSDEEDSEQIQSAEAETETQVASNVGPLLMPSPESEVTNPPVPESSNLATTAQQENTENVSYELEGEAPTEAKPNGLIAFAPTTDPGPEPTLANENELAPAPPVESGTLSFNSQVEESAGVVAPISNVDSSLDKLLDRQLQKPDTSDSSSWLFVALGVSCMAVSFLGLSIMWSRWDRKRDEQTIANMEPELAETKTESVVDSAIQEASDILDQAVPVIEERVILPKDVSLHGIAIGHRRIVIHDKHETLSGPHFNRKSRKRQTVSATQSATAEQRLREAARATKPVETAFAESFESDESLSEQQTHFDRAAPKQTSIHNAESPRMVDEVILEPSPTGPISAERTQSYDVVQQDGITDGSTTDGPLDRALRAIAREARS